VIESGEARVGVSALVVVLRSLLAVVAGSCVVLLLWTSMFMVNDDATMAAFASGDYTGHPSAHLVFVGALLGLVLAGLHTIAQPVPWFAYMLLSVEVCSIAFVLAIAYVRRGQLRVRGQIAVLALVVVFLPVLLLRPTFTVAAIVVCITGLVMLAAAVRSQSQSKHLLWVGSICIGLGAIIRFDSFVGVAAVFAPFVVLVAVRLGWRRSLTAVCLVSAVVIVSSATDHVLNSSSGWSSYLEFHDGLGPLIGNTAFDRAMSDQADPAVAKVLSNIGWNADDVVLLGNWFFYDRNVYSTEHLSALGSLTSGDKFNAPLSDSASLVLKSQRPLWILAVGLGVLALASRRWQVWALIATQLAWSTAVFSITAASQRFPERVSIPMYLAVGLVFTVGMPLVLNEPSPSQSSTLPLHRALTSLVAVAGVISAFYVLSDGYTPWAMSRANEVTISRYHDQLQELDRVDPDGRFLCLGAYMTIEGTDALATTSGYRSNKVLCTGWPMLSPSFAQRQSALGFTPTTLDALATDPHTYLILDQSTMPVFQRLYERYLGLNVTLDVVGHVDTGADITRVRLLPKSNGS
jgi:hypothetical protein